MESRRSMLAAAGCLAGLGACGNLPRKRDTDLQAQTQALAQESFEANALLLRGDAAGYLERVRLSEDFVLMSPFGGKPSEGNAFPPERVASLGAFFHAGKLHQEVVGTWATADMVVLAVIEHARAEVGGLPMQDWHLRVTLVYRREEGRWRLTHRHADPLVADLSVVQSAALAGRAGT